MMWWLQNRKTKKRWDSFDGECDYPANETIKDRGKCEPGGPEFQRKNTRIDEKREIYFIKETEVCLNQDRSSIENLNK